MNFFQRLIFSIRTRWAIKDAVALSKGSGKRYLVLNVKGRPQVIAQTTIRTLIRQHLFRKGTTLNDIRRKALFITK